MNDEEQYSLWPADLPVPAGWTETGQQDSKQDCDGYVNRVWSDMRPKSLRDAMAAGQAERQVDSWVRLPRPGR